MSWQGDQGYNCSAVTPHASQVAVVIGRLRAQLQTLTLTLVPLAALIVQLPSDIDRDIDIGLSRSNSTSDLQTALHLEMQSELNTRFPDSAADRAQMRVPLALRKALPPWLAGSFAAAMLGFFISTHTTYLHAWGTIL